LELRRLPEFRSQSGARPTPRLLVCLLYVQDGFDMRVMWWAKEILCRVLLLSILFSLYYSTASRSSVPDAMRVVYVEDSLPRAL
jgi:hypothetical protein